MLVDVFSSSESSAISLFWLADKEQRSVMELYATGKTTEDLHVSNRDNSDRWQHHAAGSSFRFSINAYNHSIPKARKVQIMESFGYMDWKGVIDIANPDVVLTYFEECMSNPSFIIIESNSVQTP